jgi:hypothetical protein
MFVCVPSALARILITILQGEKYRVTAYDSIVTIVEPEVSIFDFKLYDLNFRYRLPLELMHFVD